MSRLKIGKAANYLDLKRDTSIQIDAQSPLWFGDRQGDVLPNVKIYSFSLPSTPHNRILLNRPELLDNADDFLAENDWLMLYDGKIIERGRLEVEEAANEGGDYKATFIGGIAGKLYALKDENIGQILSKTVPLGINNNVAVNDDEVLAQAKLITATPESSDFLFPTIQVAEDTEFDEDDIPQNYEYLNWYFQDQFRRQRNTGLEHVNCSLAPQFKLRNVLDELLNAVSYSLTGIFDSSQYREELNNLLLFSNTTLDEVPGDEVELQYNNMAFARELDYSVYLPRIKGNDLLRATADTFALAIIASPQRRTISLLPYDYALKSKSVDWTTKVGPRYIKARRLEAAPFRFQYDHLSEDYSEANRLELNGKPVSYEVETFDDMAALDLNFQSKGEIVYVRSLNEYYVILRADSSGRGLRVAPVGKNLGIINEDAATPFSPASDTLHMITDRRDALFCPAYFADVVTPIDTGSSTIDKPVFLIYRGLQPSRRYSGKDSFRRYPLASSYNYNEYEEKVGELSLLWNGPDGLYNRWWKTWHEALQRMRPITMTARLTATDLEQLDWMKRIEIDGKLFLLRRIQITVTNTQISVANIELMQLL